MITTRAADNLIGTCGCGHRASMIIAINYRAHRGVWRRVVVRGDGCGTADCSGSGNPDVSFTVYDSMDVSVQNMLLVDRVLAGGDSPYADFLRAAHQFPLVLWAQRWLSVMSLNSPDIGFCAGQTGSDAVAGADDPVTRCSGTPATEA